MASWFLPPTFNPLQRFESGQYRIDGAERQSGLGMQVVPVMIPTWSRDQRVQHPSNWTRQPEICRQHGLILLSRTSDHKPPRCRWSKRD